MRTVRAKGLSQSKMLATLRNDPAGSHITRTAVCVYADREFCREKIFTIPDSGNDFMLDNRDYTLIMGTTIFLAALIVTMNLMVDIAYKLIDPRIKLK